MGNKILSLICFMIVSHGLIEKNLADQIIEDKLYSPSNGFPVKSISTANSEAYEKQIGINGIIGIGSTETRTKSVTKTVDDAFGHTKTEIARGDSHSTAINIGKFGISNKFSTLNKLTNDGHMIREFNNNINVGNFGLGTKISTRNMNNGFSINKNQNGGLNIDMGLLSVDLGKSNNHMKYLTGVKAVTNAGAFANGKNTKTHSYSNSNSKFHNIGILDISSATSKSNALAESFGGTTGAFGNANANSQFHQKYKRFASNRPKSSFVFPREPSTSELIYFLNNRFPHTYVLPTPPPPTNGIYYEKNFRKNFLDVKDKNNQLDKIQNSRSSF